MRTRMLLPLLAAAIALVGCAEIFDELDMSPEDREVLEDLMEGIADAASAGGDDAFGGNGDGDGPPVDPGWSPDGMPPPPGEPSQSSDYSDDPYCPAGHACGHASYDGDDGAAAREHYEDVFGRPPDSEETQPFSDGEDPYDAVTSTWDDGTVEVSVYTDHHGTDVHVRSETAAPS